MKDIIYKSTMRNLMAASLLFTVTATSAVADDLVAKSCPVEDGRVTINSRVGPTGFIEILQYGIFASFREDDQIITASNAPNCVGWVRSSNKPLSTAGDPFSFGKPDITASSSAYTNNPILIEPDRQNFYLFGDTLFDATAPATVQFETQGSVSMPAIPKTRLHSPGPGVTKMISPVNFRDAQGNFGVIPINSGEDYEVAWEKLNPAPAKNMAVSLYQIVASSPIGSSKLSQINCVFPYADGQGKIPSSLMTEIRTRTLNGQPSTIQVDAIPGIQAFPGEAKMINIRDANYFVYVSRSDSVDQLFPNGVTLERPFVDCNKGNVKHTGCAVLSRPTKLFH